MSIPDKRLVEFSDSSWCCCKPRMDVRRLFYFAKGKAGK